MHRLRGVACLIPRQLAVASTVVIAVAILGGGDPGMAEHRA